MTTKYKVAIAAGSLLTAFASGYYLAPAKIKTEIRTVEVEKKAEQTKTDDKRKEHRDTTVHTIVKPDGSKETTTHTVVDTGQDLAVSSKVNDQTSVDADQKKEVEKSGKTLNLSLLAGTNISFTSGLGTIIYGGSISTSLIGPVSVGLWGMSNATGGFSVGLNF